MQIFISGTDTNVGKTVISSWLCLHSGYDYFKPIQTGTQEDRDKDEIRRLSPTTRCHPEVYSFKDPLSPHQAAFQEHQEIDCQKLILPKAKSVIIEGAGGLMVPLNPHTLLIDLIRIWQVPVLLVARTTLGTLNHTLLSLEALRTRSISVKGIILNGPAHQANRESLEFYGQVPVLAWIPPLAEMNSQALSRIPFPSALQTLLKGYSDDDTCSP